MTETIEVTHKLDYEVNNKALDESIMKLQKIHDLLLQIKELSSDLFSKNAEG